jgi:hypothetical protein
LKRFTLGLTELTMVGADRWGTIAPKRLQRQGEQLHEVYVRSAYHDTLYRSHESLIEYKVYLNTYDEVNAIIKALVNYADLAEYSQADFAYLETGKMPVSVLTPLRNASIYVVGRINGYVPEDEYRVGY